MNEKTCFSCGKYPLSKDEVGITKKVLGRKIKRLYCLNCLSAYLDIPVGALMEKIEEFKDEGCALFQ